MKKRGFYRILAVAAAVAMLTVSAYEVDHGAVLLRQGLHSPEQLCLRLRSFPLSRFLQGKIPLFRLTANVAGAVKGRTTGANTERRWRRFPFPTGFRNGRRSWCAEVSNQKRSVFLQGKIPLFRLTANVAGAVKGRTDQPCLLMSGVPE